MESKRIVIADPGTQNRQRLAAAINRTLDLTVTGETHDGQELLRSFSHGQCDVVVMDLGLASTEELEVLNRIRSLPVRPAIVILSGVSSDCAARHGAQCPMLQPNSKASGHRSSDPEAVVTNLLHDFGLPARLRGCQYLRDSIVIAAKDASVLDGITKILYPRLAKHYNTSPGAVERAIRHAIEIVWSNASPALLSRYFSPGLFPGKRPTNSDFIARIAQHLRCYRDQSNTTGQYFPPESPSGD